MAEDSPDLPRTVDQTRPHLGKGATYPRYQRFNLMMDFLNAFRMNGNISLSCRIANIGRSAVYEWVKENVDGFQGLFQTAAEEANERIEEEVFRRAVTGWDEPVFYKGAECGGVRKFSDILLIFLAKARMPAKYRDKFEGVNVQYGDTYSFGNLSVGERNNVINAIAAMPEEELKRLAERGRENGD